MNSLREECGIFGIFDDPNAAQMAYLGLFSLQHRGQESAGIITYHQGNRKFSQVKNNGLVSTVFRRHDIEGLKGHAAIGHVRYSTTGEDNSTNIQPVLADCIKGELGVAHNGNLTNARELYEELRASGAIFQTTLDTEVFVHLIARSAKTNIVDAIMDALSRVEGSFSLLILTADMLIAARDPYGVRPLCMGDLNGKTVFASETCAFDLVNAKYLREVEPGEMILVSTSGVESRQFATKKTCLNKCIFEYIYFSRPDSLLFGKSVYEMQKKFGQKLSEESPVEADVVIPVPDSGNCAALGYSQASGIPFEMGLVRNHYIGRTFIQNSQVARESGVRIKLNPVKHVIEGKRLIVIDDSLVRGTTSRKICKMIRDAGAKEIHLRISSPPYKHSCFYGVDTPSPDHLIASNKTIEDIRQFIGVDSLAYLSEEGLLATAAGDAKSKDAADFCMACFDGNYKIPYYSLKDTGKGALEKK